MAAGVTQPGAPGTTISVEDNANADANLDGIAGTYSLRDVALKALASGDYTDLGTNTADRTYRSKATVQNGDGTGTAATTIKDTNSTLVFDTGKTLTSSTVGVATRKLELGEKIQGATGKPGGKNGCKIVTGAPFVFRGIIKLYGSLLRTASGALSMLPDDSVEPSELVNCILQSATSLTIGIGTTNRFATIYNVEIISAGSGLTAVVTSWGADQAERITIECTSPQRFVRTTAILRVRDLVLIGTPTVSDVSFIGGVADRDLIEVIWSGNATQVDGVIVGNFLNEWWRFLPIVSGDETGSPKLDSVPVVVLDKNGADLTGILYTDSEGSLSYNLVDPLLPIFDNVLKARRAASTPAVWEELGPFTARYNLDGTIRTDYVGTSVEFNFPRVTGAFGDQLGPVLDVVKLKPIGSSAWTEIPVDTVV